jgi:uncharacterized protein YdcH (DUF465 family)
VDLAKVQDIVRALRRRYQSRSNVQTIFKDWDKSGKGFLEPNDIQTMLDKMGLKVNRDEAEMLVLCIDTDGNERVTMNEFLDLVFTQNDGISSLDLNRMGVGNEYLGSGEERKQSFVEELKKKAELAAKLRPMNQWKFFIQKNLNNIAMDLLAVDSDRKYYVEYKDLMKVIDRRAKIPEYLKQESGDLLHEFMGQYVDHNNGHVDYRTLVEDIREFNYEQANQKGTAGGDLQETRIAAFSKTPGNEARKRKTIFEDNYIVLDSQKVPPNMLDQIDQRLHKVTRHLKRAFGTEAKLDAAIKEAVGEPEKNGNMSVDELKAWVIQACKDQMVHRDIGKKDIEAFLSAFNYNAYGATNIDNVAKIVFTNDNYVSKELARKTRANPPPDAVNTEMLESIRSVEVDDLQKSSKTETNSPNKQAIDYKKAAAVLKEIENKVFIGGLPRNGTY